MTVSPNAANRAAHRCFVLTLLLLLVGLVPVPARWTGVRALLGSAKSPELNRADREAQAAGYYEGIIGGGDGPEGAPGELTMRLLGKPVELARFHASNVTQNVPHEFIQFELKPNMDKMLFGRRFTTNPQGMRDDPRTRTKPPDTFRIAVLGSSIDMGWGIALDETYVHRLEGWLNAHAARRGTSRRFEVLNFGVAAHGPLQRLEAFHRKAAAYQPDMVLFSATMLDARLMEIHLCDMFHDNVRDLRYDFVRVIFAEAGITEDDRALDSEGKLVHKERIKAKLRPFYNALYDGALQTLAADCRSAGIPLAIVILPRVGKADAPEVRAEPVARIKGSAARHLVPVFDLSGTFDHIDPARIEIAAWDDHPNALGHEKLFRALARGLVQDPKFARTLFPDVPARGQETPRDD